MISNNPDAD